MSEQESLIRRESWADACRLIAMFGVILIHTSAPVFYDYRSVSLDAFLTANAIDSLARVSVPLFAMLSGALLLGRDASIGIAGGGGRVARVVLPLVFWSFIYAFWVDYWTGKPLDFFGALSHMGQAPVMYHLWFVYMIIGVYLILPILRPISSALIDDKKLAIYFFILWFSINSITIYYPISLIQQLKLSGLLGWPGYFILGYYLSRSEWLMSISVRLNIFVFVLASLLTFFLSWHFNSISPTPTEVAYEYFSPNVLLASCAAFLWIKKIKVHNCIVKPLEFFSGMVFPIYFMHLLIIEILKGGILGFSITPYSIHPVVGILGLAVVTFFASMSIAVLIRFIPHSSRIIG